MASCPTRTAGAGTQSARTLLRTCWDGKCKDFAEDLEEARSERDEARGGTDIAASCEERRPRRYAAESGLERSTWSGDGSLRASHPWTTSCARLRWNAAARARGRNGRIGSGVAPRRRRLGRRRRRPQPSETREEDARHRGGIAGRFGTTIAGGHIGEGSISLGTGKPTNDGVELLLIVTSRPSFIRFPFLSSLLVSDSAPNDSNNNNLHLDRPRLAVVHLPLLHPPPQRLREGRVHPGLDDVRVPSSPALLRPRQGGVPPLRRLQSRPPELGPRRPPGARGRCRRS
ncbi:hypothetical protein ACHAWF_004613 [Thalassiosira exigua]